MNRREREITEHAWYVKGRLDQVDEQIRQLKRIKKEIKEKSQRKMIRIREGKTTTVDKQTLRAI